MDLRLLKMIKLRSYVTMGKIIYMNLKQDGLRINEWICEICLFIQKFLFFIMIACDGAFADIIIDLSRGHFRGCGDQ